MWSSMIWPAQPPTLILFKGSVYSRAYFVVYSTLYRIVLIAVRTIVLGTIYRRHGVWCSYSWVCSISQFNVWVQFILQYSVKYSVQYCTPDMEFVTNFTRTYVFIKSFTPKYSVNFDFLGHEENINLPLCNLIIILYTWLYLCFFYFYFIGPKNT